MCNDSFDDSFFSQKPLCEETSAQAETYVTVSAYGVSCWNSEHSCPDCRSFREAAHGCFWNLKASDLTLLLGLF